MSFQNERRQTISAEITSESRVSAIRELAKLPLFQLATAGMELFHTNMLYWLATQRPDESVAVWDTFGLPGTRIDPQSAFIRREWHHIDLIVAPGDAQPALVLENKIGAIPAPDQLNRYHAGLRSGRPPFDPESADYVLLTLTPSSFVLPMPWRSITYRDLLPALRETARNLAGADDVLIGAYVDMVERLDQLAAAYDPDRDRDGLIALQSEEWHTLNESRLLSLVEKVRAGRFAELLTRSLPTELRAAGEVGTGYTNGSAIYQWFMPGPAGRRFGWQIQGGQFRLAVIAANEDPQYGDGLEELVARLYESYFDFSVPDYLGDALSPYRRRRPWLGYRPHFVYRYKELTPDTTWNDLLGLVEWFSRHTLAYVAEFPSAQ